MELLKKGGWKPRTPPRVISLAVCTSIVAHGALVSVVTLVPREASPTETPIEIAVEVVAPPMDAAYEPTIEAPAVPLGVGAPSSRLNVLASRPARVRRLPRPSATAPAPAPVSATVPPTVDQTGPMVAASSDSAQPPPPSTTATLLPANAGVPATGALVLAANTSSHPSGTTAGGGYSADPASGPAAAADGQRRRELALGYRDHVARTRIRAHFRYPPAARELELAGQVVVAATIRKDGSLVSVRLAGPCPHPVLCADGLDTVRAAAPFPAIPRGLGETVQIEVPFNYAFE